MLISIIMPVYNNEKYFPLAVKSIVEQDYLQWELIIIDDGSTDKTSIIADKIAKEDERITVIHQSNQWIYASLNRGIEEAKGDYIYFINSDDKIEKGGLGLIAKNAERFKPDVIWTKVLVHECDSEQNITAYNVGKWDEYVKYTSFYKNKTEVRNNWPYLLSSYLAQNQANLYCRKLLRKHKFRTDVYAADLLFNIAIAPDVNSALVLKEPVYDFFIYKSNKLNASVGKYYSYEHDMFNEIYQKYMDLFDEWKLSTDNYQELLVGRRLKQVTHEINSLFYKTCPLSLDQKLKQILCKIPDETVIACAKLEHREEELESRILSGLRILLLREEIKQDSEMYFAYELLESLLRYEKDEEDFKKIENAVWHPHNPAHIGQIFYNKLKRDR